MNKNIKINTNNISNVQSMTGFSSTTITLSSSKKEEPINLTISLKTLNSRFFETNFKLPYSLSHIETGLIGKLKKKLLRGTIFLTIHMSNSRSISSKIKPSLETIKEYLNSIKAIKKEFDINGEILLTDIIKLPNIFEHQEQTIQKDIINHILKNIDNLVVDLIKAREKEGLALKKDIESRIKNIEKYTQELIPRANIVAQNKKDEFLKSLEFIQKYNKENPVANSSSINPTNLVHQLDKSDIHEEITRFKTHIDNFNKVINSKDISKGRKLDFTLQELFREINTICAKCSDNIISELAINIKVELEKAREQIQNIV